MGVGSFGGFNAGAAYMATRGLRGGYGGGSYGGDNSPEDEKTNFNWKWFSLNAFLLSLIIFFFCFMKSDYANYTRVGTLLSKYQTKHKHKGSYYSISFFTVKWKDRSQEGERFEVAEETYSSCKLNDNVYFRRMKPDYEWMNKGSGFALITVLFLTWLISGLAAITKGL